ncbi:hypothetical protein RN001_006515 [Aquatica leii]|uniref:Spermatogenesis-associated protein 13 n=1 Tax=Aquatica leii TaxID=1421715 RepID=A0AAN7PIN7_9COLE|nr:hypothetical protein RN001_006515 [Aquatica leii]
MNRDEVYHLRDRLLMLAECSNPHKPQNIKRKSRTTTIPPKTRSKSGPKWSMQDFVRRDPGYTPDIEHLVFPGRKAHSQQEAPNPTPSKTRSRLAEMFALSRHLQQRSTDRNVKTRTAVNRSMDSALGPPRTSSVGLTGSNPRGTDTAASTRRWVAVEEPVHQTSSSTIRLSPAAEPEMATTRGPNVSVLHLRSTSEPWETSPTSAFASGGSSRSFSSGRTTNVNIPPLTKHQSLGNQSYKWDDSTHFHSERPITSGDLFIKGSCSRELSPVRWCDREVDGVYLGRSGWVQVQQRSLDENRKSSYGNSMSGSLELSRRTGIKLANYHFNSEPAKRHSECRTELQRPAYLPLNTCEHESISKSPSPPLSVQESSPPSITPIISPPPAFQDRKSNNLSKTRTFFGKPPFLPRSNAIVDSDIISPPPTPPTEKKLNRNSTLPQVSQSRKIKLTPSPVSRPMLPYPRIPQTKSLEDTSNIRRKQFLQRHGESSSSSSSSMGFRSLDSCVNRPTMPKLSENTDSSIDMYEDADEEDNNSSSINVSIVSAINTNQESSRLREKISPSGRARVHRPHTRRSPASSDTNKPANCSSRSSSSSSNEGFPSRSPSNVQPQLRRSAPVRQYNTKNSIEDAQKVRRSRSLQLPDKKPAAGYRDTSIQNRVSPQHPEAHRVVVKMGNAADRLKRHNVHPAKVQSLEGGMLEEGMLREAEFVTEYLYGTRSHAAAQALLMHRYNNPREEKLKESLKLSSNNGYEVFYVGNSNKEKQKSFQRGATTPNLNTQKQPFKTSPTSENINACNSNTCDFWPHCAHRDSLNSRGQSSMRLSQSYPTHQMSLDVVSTDTNRTIQEQLKKRNNNAKSDSGNVLHMRKRVELFTPGRSDVSDYKIREKRLSPNRSSEVKRDLSADKKISPVTSKNASRSPSAIGNSSNSSSSSEIWVTTSDRTASKSSKNAKSSGTSTPLDEGLAIKDEHLKEVILSRPGSAPTDDNCGLLESQQRSMSLPKSFLAVNYQQGIQPHQKHESESLRSSPGSHRRTPTPETSHTAPVTPSHEVNRRRSPIENTERRVKATSTPQLLDSTEIGNRKRSKNNNIHSHHPGTKDLVSQRSLPGASASESVLQKFKKTFSLRFQKKGSKECCNIDLTEQFSEVLREPSEEDSPQRVPSLAETNPTDVKEENTEQKYRFGPLIWRSSKERKKTNKAARSTKCNSGDSGIQIEMVSGSGGAGGDSSESHDTDPPGDELDSPPTVRRRALSSNKTSRPHSDLLNKILIDKFKAELQYRAHRHHYIRRTHSDLGGQRLFQWDPRSSYRRLMSSPAPLQGRPQRMSPRKKPPDAPGAVQLRTAQRRGQLRRSLSQPVDIDKLSPLMRTKTAGLRLAGGNILSEDEHDGRVGTSEDEMMSDSESSIASLTERKKSLELAMDEDVIILAEAVFDHVAIEAEELAFRAGDVIEVLETVNRDWWWGSAGGKEGWFPAAFVRLRVSQEDTVEDCLAAMASGQSMPTQLRRRTSISLLSNDQVRTSVVRELVHTEREFVKVLQDVAEGYISECRKRKDMFTKEQLDIIFINLEDILKFQKAFLKDLESCIDWDAPNKSCVGNCFIKRKEGFEMYSDYCNSHPIATALLQELYQFNNYCKFFEACRLMRGLIEIPLDGYLLTPVQRICKYPLQLAELLKYTKSDHPDYENIKDALKAMRGVAVLINERKRRMESLEKLAAWQQRVEGWEGEDLIETSTQLIHQGEAVRVTSGMWTSNITLFLFDHQLVYCKKDILKRNTYVYKGRIDMDTSEVIDIPDGKDMQTGVSVRHALRVYSCLRDKWILYCLRSSVEKQKWLYAFSEERKLVAQDKSDGLDFPPAAKQLARIAARTQRRPPRKPRGNKSYKLDSAYMGSSLQLTPQNSNSLGRKVGTWFTFGVNRKTRHQHRDVS